MIFLKNVVPIIWLLSEVMAPRPRSTKIHDNKYSAHRALSALKCTSYLTSWLETIKKEKRRRKPHIHIEISHSCIYSLVPSLIPWSLLYYLFIYFFFFVIHAYTCIIYTHTFTYYINACDITIVLSYSRRQDIKV